MRLVIIDEHNIQHLVTCNIERMDTEPSILQDQDTRNVTSEEVISKIKIVVNQIKD